MFPINTWTKIAPNLSFQLIFKSQPHKTSTEMTWRVFKISHKKRLKHQQKVSVVSLINKNPLTHSKLVT